jgi:hypothetical protein
MSTTTYLRSRVDRSSLALGLAAGDLLALSVFVVVGAQNHGERPFANPEVVVGALAPFLLAWWATALVGGLYTTDAVLGPRRALSWGLPAWVATVVIGQALRATPLFRGGFALTFMLVTLVVGGTLVLGWRVLFASVLARQ